MLFKHSSRQARLSQSAKLGQPAQVVGVATVQELAEPWSSKTFIFHRPETKEDISSIVIRSPDSAPDQPGSYWAFSMQPLLGKCQLEYVTDLQRLSYDYRFQAKHPMVNACDADYTCDAYLESGACRLISGRMSRTSHSRPSRPRYQIYVSL
jgi:hypothetical protein